MTCRRPLAIVLALALVLAQQMAIAHQLWHVLDPGAKSPQSQLCLQHGALDTVAGAVDAPAAPLAAIAPLPDAPRAIVPRSTRAAGLAPASRGPPALP